MTVNLDEDLATITACVSQIEEWLDSGTATLLDHTHLADSAEPSNRFPLPESSAERIAAIKAGRLKRFVVSCQTARGPRAIKFFAPVGWANRLYYAGHASPSRRAHELAGQAQAQGLSVPTSYGYLELRAGRGLVRSAQVMELCPRLTSLGDYLRARFNAAGNDAPARHEIVRWLAQCLADLHRRGMYHPDLKPYHVFLRPGYEPAQGQPGIDQLLVIDLDRARFTARLSLRQRCHNLYQLYRYALADCHEEERRALIEAYADAFPELALDASALYRRVLRIAQQRAPRRASRKPALQRLATWAKYWLAWLFQLLLRQRPRPVTLPSTRPPRVLVVRFDRRIGNMLLIGPMLEALRSRYPEAVIDLLGNIKVHRVMQANPHLTTFHALSRWAPWARSGWLATLWRLRRRHYDLVIDAAHPWGFSLTHALVARVLAPDHCLGSVRPPIESLYSCPVRIPDSLQSVRLQYLYLLRPLGIPAEPPPPMRFYPTRTITPHGSPQVHLLLANARTAGQALVVVNLGAGNARRVLSPVVYAAIVVHLAERGFCPVLCYGPAEREQARELAAQAPEQCLLAPPTDLDELAGIMAASRAVIANDTGPMHLAVAVGTPTLALFYRSNAARFGHDYAPHRVLELDDPIDQEAILNALDEFLP